MTDQDPAARIAELLGADLTPWQRSVLERLLDPNVDRVLLNVPHRQGGPRLCLVIECVTCGQPITDNTQAWRCCVDHNDTYGPNEWECADCVLDTPHEDGAAMTDDEPWCPEHGYGCEPSNCPCGHTLRCDCRSIADER